MTTAENAIIISTASLIISIFALGWNIWSKFIFPKPSLVVGFTVMEIMDEAGLHDPFLNLSITNHGPISATISASYVQISKGLLRRRGLALLNPLSDFRSDMKKTLGPFSGGLPKKLEVGEEFSLKYWYGMNWLDERVVRVGVRDSFNRMQWCRRRDIRRVTRRYLEDKTAGKLAKLER
jgi:hypothetical protein